MFYFEEKTYSKISFVCNANMCRSPLASAIAKSLTDDFDIVSCGIRTLDGYSATHNAQKVALEKNLDLSHHRTQNHSLDLLQGSLVLCMDTKQKLFLKQKYDNLNVYLLAEKGSESMEVIKDPTNKDLNAHRETFKSLYHEINILLGKLSR